MSSDRPSRDPPGPTPSAAAPSADQRRALDVLTVVLAALALVTLRSLLAPLVVGAWFAGLAAPFIARLAGRFGHRQRLAGLATAALVFALLAPLLLLALPLASLVEQALSALSHPATGGALRRWLDAAPVNAAPAATTSLWTALRQLVPGFAGVASRALAAVSTGVLQLLALIASAYVFTAHGSAILAVARRGAPLAPAHFDRLLADSLRVARALLVGGLLTAVAQGLIAWGVYRFVGIANASGLALLTGVASMVPAVGSALVWMPLCAVLASAGRTREAVVLAACGAGLISTVDNLLRPFLARFGAHDVHPLVLFLGVVGGIGALGPWGLVVGPLALSLFVSAFRLRADLQA